MLAEQTTDNSKRGEELNHFSGLLFLRSASEWHWSVFLQTAASVAMVLISELRVPHQEKIFLALFSFGVFALAYYFRFASEDTFDTASTMNRQAALSEGLGWPVNNRQFSEWKSRAGTSILHQFKSTTRPDNYWTTTSAPGPKRLLELTIENGFWTSKLYKKLRSLMWAAFIFIIALALLLVCLALVSANRVGEETSSLVSAIFLLLPALLIFDILEWIFKLNRLIDDIKEVSTDMDLLSEQTEITESQVMRLVSEYNAVTAEGFPIHPIFYKRWHDEIKELWETRKEN